MEAVALLVPVKFIIGEELLTWSKSPTIDQLTGLLNPGREIAIVGKESEKEDVDGR